MSARRLLSAILVLLCVLVCGAMFSGAVALAARGHVFAGAFGAKGTGNGQFEAPSGVAVNEATGSVYVVDTGNGRVERFDSTGSVLEGQFDGSGSFEVGGKALSGTAAPTGKMLEPEGIAVDNSCYAQHYEVSLCKLVEPSNGDVYVVDAGHKAIDKFNAEGEFLNQITGTPEIGPFIHLNGVAVDSNGELWVAESTGISHIGVDKFFRGHVNEFESFRSTNEGFENSGPGFAVDSNDNLYISFDDSRTGVLAIEKYGANGKFLGEVGGVDPEVPSVATERLSDDVYVDNVGTVGRFSSSGSLIERLSTPGMTGSGVAVSAATGVVYVADSSASVVDVFVLEPPGKPKVEDESVVDVASSSSTFRSEVNPHGAPTKYRVEYGTSESYGASTPVPDGSLGSDFEVHSITVHLQGLQPHTTYHYRVVAENEHAVTSGPDESFTTQPAGVQFALPDGRQWELVSPPNKHGALIEPLSMHASIQAAVDGGAITYHANVPMESGPQGYAKQAQLVSVRGAQGWSSQDISPRHDSQTGGSVDGGEFPFFSPDLLFSIVWAGGEDATPLSDRASEVTPYVRSEALCGEPSDAGECYVPVLTGKEGFADVPPGAKFAGSGGLFGYNIPLRGASPDLKHVVLTGQVAALVSTPSIPPGTSEVYEWSAGVPSADALQLVSVLPASEGGGAATEAGVGVHPEHGAGIYDGSRHSISDDGSRIFWTMDNIITGRPKLYLRDMVKRETVALDVPQPGAPPPSGSGPLYANFQIANSDGSKAFFTSGASELGVQGELLTAQSGKSGNDLYECEIVEEAGKLKCKLTDITPEIGGRSAEVRGIVSGASEDGSYVYFVANGVLGDGAERGATQGSCGKGSSNSGTCNLYEYHNGTVTFIVTMSAADEFDWGDHLDNISSLTAQVSPDGRYLTFMSQRSLTGFDNRDASSGRPDMEVYLYDALSKRLSCVSCNPTGGRPAGVEASKFNFSSGDNFVNAGALTPESWVAANLPLPAEINGGASLYQQRLLSDAGRVFFNSSDALVPQDVNGQEDVYEFEPVGVGGCTASSVTFNAASGGCVGLISSGTSPAESGFMDASKSGGDVFFLTASRLTSQDYDNSFDVYDAHECSTLVPCLAQPVSAPPCSSGDSCKSAPALQPPIFGAPPSATFTGAGNVAGSSSPRVVAGRSLTRAQKLARALRECRKRPKRKRIACERQARGRYGGRGARKATRKAQG